MKKLVSAILLILLTAGFIYFGRQTKGKPMDANPRQFSRSEQVIETGKIYTVTLKTDAGEIAIELDSQNTPAAANNFVFLSQKGFYDNTVFHRVIKGFMIQGGDPLGSGTGGPGYRFNDEPVVGEYRRGAVAMANAGPNTNGSQFFIMHADYPLPKNYVIFGRVTMGMEAVDKIAAAPVSSSNSGENSRPVTPVKINSAAVAIR